MRTSFKKINAAQLARSQAIRRQIYEQVSATERPSTMIAERTWFNKNDSPRVLGYPLSNIARHYMGLFRVEMSLPAYAELPRLDCYGQDLGVKGPAFMEAKLRALKANVSGDEPLRVLDLGCGQGVALLELLMFADHLGIPLIAYGIDPRLPTVWERTGREALPTAVVDLYNRYVGEGRLVIRQGSIDNLFPNEDDGVENWTSLMHMVVSKQVMRYVTDRVRVLEEVHRVLARGGKAYLDHSFDFVSVRKGGTTETLLLGTQIVPELRRLGFDVCLQTHRTNEPPSVLSINKRNEESPLLLGLSLEEERVNQAVYHPYVKLEIPEGEQDRFPCWQF